MAPFWRDFFVLSKWIITMADPRRLLWQIACTHVRRLFRDRDVALAEKTQAHIATLPEPSCDSSDRSSEEFSFRRSDLAQHPAPFTGQVCRAGSRGTDTWFTCRPSRDQRNVSSPRAALILCAYHHVPIGEIARRSGVSLRVRKNLRVAISAIAAARDWPSHDK